MNYFFDSSALLKRYMREQGSLWVASICAISSGNSIMIAQITPAEVVSGAARQARDNFISTRTAHAVRLMMNRHFERQYVIVALSDSVLHKAQDLLENHPLRAYDSIQLASALIGNARLLTLGMSALTFVSADTRLLTIAAAEGLTTDDPNQHP